MSELDPKFVNSIIRGLRNALIVAANNAHERGMKIKEINHGYHTYNEMQFHVLVESALEQSVDFKSDYEGNNPLDWLRRNEMDALEDGYYESRNYLSSGGAYFGTLHFRTKEEADTANVLSSKKGNIFSRWFEFLQFLQDQGIDFKVSM
jgi:hypothetical protein